MRRSSNPRLRLRRLRQWLQSSLVQASSACTLSDGHAPNTKTLRALLEVARELEMLASSCSLDACDELMRQFEASLSSTEEQFIHSSLDMQRSLVKLLNALDANALVAEEINQEAGNAAAAEAALKSLQASLSSTLRHGAIRLDTLISGNRGEETTNTLMELHTNTGGAPPPPQGRVVQERPEGGKDSLRGNDTAGNDLGGQAWELEGGKSAGERQGENDLESIDPDTDLWGILTELLEVSCERRKILRRSHYRAIESAWGVPRSGIMSSSAAMRMWLRCVGPFPPLGPCTDWKCLSLACACWIKWTTEEVRRAQAKQVGVKLRTARASRRFLATVFGAWQTRRNVRKSVLAALRRIRFAPQAQLFGAWSCLVRHGAREDQTAKARDLMRKVRALASWRSLVFVQARRAVSGGGGREGGGGGGGGVSQGGGSEIGDLGVVIEGVLREEAACKRVVEEECKRVQYRHELQELKQQIERNAVDTEALSKFSRDLQELADAEAKGVAFSLLIREARIAQVVSSAAFQDALEWQWQVFSIYVSLSIYIIVFYFPTIYTTKYIINAFVHRQQPSHPRYAGHQTSSSDKMGLKRRAWRGEGAVKII